MLKFAGHVSSSLLGVACAAGLAAAGAPAFGQVDEFTVVGPNDWHARSLSAEVSYRDLDLTTGAGRAGLRARVQRTAETLCRRLGQDHLGGGIVPSCEDDAVRSAAKQERDVIARAVARHAAAPAGPPVVASVGSTAAKAPPAAGNFVLTLRLAPAR